MCCQNAGSVGMRTRPGVHRPNGPNSKWPSELHWSILTHKMHEPEFELARNRVVAYRALCARQNDVNATQRSAGNSSFCRAHAFQSGHLLQLIANSSFVWFIRRNFIASQILSSKIISWNFICNTKGIFKSWECYRSQPFAGNKHTRSHCQFSCQARTFTSFCRAHDERLFGTQANHCTLFGAPWRVRIGIGCPMAIGHWVWANDIFIFSYVDFCALLTCGNWEFARTQISLQNYLRTALQISSARGFKSEVNDWAVCSGEVRPKD